MSAGQNVLPDEMEVAPGFEKSHLQGAVFEASTEAQLLDVLEKAFDYRGDVTIRLRDGSEVEGYIFDRQIEATLPESTVRLFPKGENKKVTVRCDQIAGLGFTGRDTAAGKSFDAWVKKYWEKKAAGEQNIEITPERLD